MKLYLNRDVLIMTPLNATGPNKSISEVAI